MIKLGLAFEIVGFIMMFWHSVARPVRKIKDGSGSTTGFATENKKMLTIFKFIPSQKLRIEFVDHFLSIAFLLIIIGVILQLLSLNR